MSRKHGNSLIESFGNVKTQLIVLRNNFSWWKKFEKFFSSVFDISITAFSKKLRNFFLSLLHTLSLSLLSLSLSRSLLLYSFFLLSFSIFSKAHLRRSSSLNQQVIIFHNEQTFLVRMSNKKRLRERFPSVDNLFLQWKWEKTALVKNLSQLNLNCVWVKEVLKSAIES